jgi:hypothetical protein
VETLTWEMLQGSQHSILMELEVLKGTVIYLKNSLSATTQILIMGYANSNTTYVGDIAAGDCVIRNGNSSGALRFCFGFAVH